MFMRIFITQWALDSYLNLISNNVFSTDEYKNIIRPDVLLLAKFPHYTKFSQGKFWSGVQDTAGEFIANGYKMNWHQIGPGRVQLRLAVGIFNNECYLCEAYVKSNEKKDKRQIARFKTQLQLIKEDKFIVRGRLA